MKSVAPPNHLIRREETLSDEFISETARLHGTPFFAYHSGILETDYAALRAALPKEADILYSVKANPALDVIEALGNIGAGFEVCSRGEIMALAEAGCDPAKALMCGPGKTLEDIEFAGRMGVGMIAAESLGELKRIEAAGKRLGTEYRVLLRVNPGGGAGQQRMSGATQFGMDGEDVAAAIEECRSMERVIPAGFHFFLGTRVLDWRTLAENVRTVFETAELITGETGFKPSVVDIGGGFGVPLYHGEHYLDMERAGEALSGMIREHLDKNPWTRRILVESGRYLTASSGVFVTRVVDVKTVRGRIFAVTDGGIHAIGGRDAYFGSRATPMRVIGRAGEPLAEVTVCGPLCTPADRLANRVSIPLPEPGGLIAFYNAGAYGPTASAGLFLSRGFPAEVISDGGQAKPVKRPSWWGAMEKLRA